MLNSRLIILLIWCASTTLSLGQTSFNISTYIQKRVETLDNSSERSLPNNQFNASWIDGMDIRTETDEFEFNRQRYLIRVSPNTPKIRTAQSNLHQLYLEKAALQNTLLKRDFIEIAYEEVLFFYETFRKISIKEDLLLVLKDQEKVWGKLSQVSQDLPKDWLEIQEDIAQLEIDIYKEVNILKLWDAKALRLNWQDLIPADSILFLLENNPNNRFLLQAKEYDIENLIIEREEALEQAEQKKLLDFIQVEYRGPHEDLLRERISLTAAFRLPFSSGSKLKLAEIAIEKETLQQELIAEKKLNQYKEKESRKKLELLVQELIFSKKLYAEQSKKMLAIAQQSRALRGDNPLFTLYQKEAQIERKLEVLKLEVSIYSEYLDYLKLTEELFSTSSYNLLSKATNN